MALIALYCSAVRGGTDGQTKKKNIIPKHAKKLLIQCSYLSCITDLLQVIVTLNVVVFISESILLKKSRATLACFIRTSGGVYF